eukprot:9057714-Pyramimonas_sp.AAC.1
MGAARAATKEAMWAGRWGRPPSNDEARNWTAERLRYLSTTPVPEKECNPHAPPTFYPTALFLVVHPPPFPSSSLS